MSLVRRIVTVSAVALLAAALAGGVFASGARHASATFVDSRGVTIGWARLVEDATGVVHVNVHVKGLAPGLHGIHIHAAGACTPTFGDAMGHYNPAPGHQHGLDNPDGPHAGDLPNLIVNAAGVGRLNATTDHVTLSPGATTVFDTTTGAVGSAFIIHANEDDQFTDATNGNSGARIACAVIEAN